MKLRIIIVAIALFTTCSAQAQSTVPPTDTLYITGKIKNPVVFTLADLSKLPQSPVKDQTMYNHKGEIKETLTGIKGIPIKTLLASAEYIHDNPKVLNGFYFVFTASDGYKIVFSWNEIYNTEVGNNVFLITEMNGKKLNELEKRLFFVSTGDLKNGRRSMRGLKKIEVRQVE